VRVDHQLDRAAQRGARRVHPREAGGHAAVHRAHAHLHRAEAALDVGTDLRPDVFRGCPAAARIGRDRGPTRAADEREHRRIARLASQVPQRQVDARDRREVRAAPPEDRQRPPDAARMAGARTVVHALPEGADLARVLALEQRRELLLDDRDQRGAVPGAPHRRLRLAVADEPVLGAHRDEDAVEGRDAAEVGGVPALLGERAVQPDRLDAADLHARAGLSG
jgi:hypothetical protein